MTVLTLLATLLVLVFLGVLAYAVAKIAIVLDSIGGSPTSYLGKLRFGLRAIAKETGHLPPQVSKVNAGLKEISGGLAAVDGHLVKTIDGLEKQGG